MLKLVSLYAFDYLEYFQGISIDHHTNSRKPYENSLSVTHVMEKNSSHLHTTSGAFSSIIAL